VFCKKYFYLFFLLFIYSCSKEIEKEIIFAVGGTPNETEFWEVLIREFEAEKGIEVELLRQPADTDLRRQGLVIPLNASQSDPDVFMMDVAWVAQFAASGWLESLDTFVEEDSILLENFFEKIIRSVDTFKEQLIALPVYVDAGLLYYRADLLEKYGYKRPPETWVELVDYSLTIGKDIRRINAQFSGFVWQGAQYEGLLCTFLEFAASHNGGILFENGRIILDIPENREALRFMYDLIHTSKVSPKNTFTEMKEEEARIIFQQGNALFERNWPYAWSLHRSNDSPVRDYVRIAPLPHFKSGRSAAALGGWHIGISRYSDRKPESWEFAAFVLSYPVQKRLALELGWNPGRRDIYKDKEVLEILPHFTALEEVFENAVPRPVVPYYTQISEIIQNAVNSALSGRLTPEDALSRAENEAQNIIERYR